MALNAATLASLIKSNIEGISNFPSSGISPIFADDRVVLALATAIVTHITGAAVVNSTGGDPQGGIVTSVGTIT